MAAIAQRRRKKSYGKRRKRGEVIQIDDQNSPGAPGRSASSVSLHACILNRGTVSVNSTTFIHEQTDEKWFCKEAEL
jgi:hypothetical protein